MTYVDSLRGRRLELELYFEDADWSCMLFDARTSIPAGGGGMWNVCWDAD